MLLSPILYIKWIKQLLSRRLPVHWKNYVSLNVISLSLSLCVCVCLYCTCVFGRVVKASFSWAKRAKFEPSLGHQCWSDLSMQISKGLYMFNVVCAAAGLPSSASDAVLCTCVYVSCGSSNQIKKIIKIKNKNMFIIGSDMNFVYSKSVSVSSMIFLWKSNIRWVYYCFCVCIMCVLYKYAIHLSRIA